MITIEKSHQSLTLTFRRRRIEKSITIILALVTVFAIYGALRINVFPQRTEIVCDRDSDVCRVSGPDILGGGWTYSFAASAMKRSQVVGDESGDPKWVVELSSGRVQELGAPTGRRSQQEQYAENAAVLQGFIDNPDASRFEARFDSIGGPSDIVWVI